MHKTIYLLLLIFVAAAAPAISQKIKVSGKITDASSKQPLQGVSIVIKASNAGTVTDQQGDFSINANSNDELDISYIGFEMQAVKINGRETIDIALTPSVSDLGQIVLVGSRSGGRVHTETPVPVDVININQAGQTTAKTDLTSLLNVAAPSFNYNKQSGSDGADAIDLATLRGLGPDQTLVLINGKRRHQTAFVALFGTRGRGNSGTDLNAIPEAAIDRVEILRDGASAQYGSDAIAGVINIILKKDVRHLTLSAGWAGYADHKYNTLNNADPGQYVTGHQIDGNTAKFGIDYGLPLGKHAGFINLAGNFLSQGKTFRQAQDTNVNSNAKALPVNGVRRAFGDASLISGGAMINAEVPIANTKTTYYLFGGYNYKSSEAYAYSRNFSERPDRFPTGADGNLIFVPDIMHYTNPSNPANGEIYFNPLENVHITDASLATGFKGAFGSDWTWDVSNTIGGNNFHYFSNESFNASLGAAAADITHFDDGGFYFLQNTVNAGISKHFSTVAQGFSLSFGAEYRYEQYGIYAGEPASYLTYDTLKAGGAQGFPGYQPSDAVKARRNNFGAYIDGELDVTKQWLVGVAGRFENYSDFGALGTFKFDTRYKITPNFNLRGSASTGYRAPSLQQINYSNTFTNVQGGKIFEVKIAPNSSPITKAAGIPELKQEKSFNASLGFSWKPTKPLTITVDGYTVKIKDRVVLSGAFDESVAALAPILNQLNVVQAQFYANAVNTTNVGLDVVTNFSQSWGKNSFKALLAGNWQYMKIDKVNTPEALNNSEAERQAFFSDRERKYVLASAPPVKGNLSLEYGRSKVAIGTHVTYYGKIKILGYGDEKYNYGGKLVDDVYLSYKFSKALTLFVGGDNILNVHPDFGVESGNIGSAYDGEAGGAWDPVQMGFNGTRLFARVAVSL